MPVEESEPHGVEFSVNDSVMDGKDVIGVPSAELQYAGKVYDGKVYGGAERFSLNTIPS